MFRSALLLAAAAAISLAAAAGAANAHNGFMGLKVFDQDPGTTILDDDRLDNKGCAFGKEFAFVKAAARPEKGPPPRCTFDRL